LVFLDESGVTTKMARPHARAPRGQRAYGSIPLGSWQRLTVLGALACEGLIASMSIEASTSTSVLLAYLEQVLVPKLQQVKPDAILVMDNLRPHHATEVRDLLDQAGIGLLYLPRYSCGLILFKVACGSVSTFGKSVAPGVKVPLGVAGRSRINSCPVERGAPNQDASSVGLGLPKGWNPSYTAARFRCQ
jgi:hypothetical protein